jgi:hypothetical protein
LNVRTTDEMALVLVRAIQCRAVESIPEKEVYKEFVHLLSDRLMVYLWGSKNRPFKRDGQFLSTPQKWPRHEPTASAAFIVENLPIEVRLWTESKKGRMRPKYHLSPRVGLKTASNRSGGNHDV